MNVQLHTHNGGQSIHFLLNLLNNMSRPSSLESTWWRRWSQGCRLYQKKTVLEYHIHSSDNDLHFCPWCHDWATQSIHLQINQVYHQYEYLPHIHVHARTCTHTHTHIHTPRSLPSMSGKSQSLKTNLKVTLTISHVFCTESWEGVKPGENFHNHCVYHCETWTLRQ